MAESNVTAQFFDAQVEGFSEQYSRKPCFIDRLQLFVEAVTSSTPKNARILDFGCGPGIIALSLAERGYNVVGLDGSTGMITKAQASTRKKGLPNAEFRLMDAANLQLESEAFDAVVCSSVLEYVPDDIGLVRKLAGSLKPGGYLAVSVPHTASVLAAAEGFLRATGFHLKRKGSQHLGLTLHRYHRGAFLRELEAAGFANFRCTTFEFPFFGRFGTVLSRSRFFGGMLLVVGCKTGLRAA